MKNFDIDSQKLKELIEQGKIQEVSASDVKQGDRVIAYNGMYFEGVIVVEKTGSVRLGDSSKPYSYYTTTSVYGKNEFEKGAIYSYGDSFKVLGADVKLSDFVKEMKDFTVTVLYKGGFEHSFKLQLDKNFKREDVEFIFEEK